MTDLIEGLEPVGNHVEAPKSESLRVLYWRSEILQVMYWLRGEGFGDLVDPGLIERFLGVDAANGITYLDQLVTEGYVTRDGDWFSLSPMGLEEGSLVFADAFSELMKPTHGECSADCWCHQSADEAVACASQRAIHDHDAHEHDAQSHDAQGHDGHDH